jgi:hypothetical protein
MNTAENLSSLNEECEAPVKVFVEDKTYDSSTEVLKGSEAPDEREDEVNVAEAVDDKVAVSSQDFATVDQKSAEAEQTEAKKRAEELQSIMPKAEKTKRVYNKQKHASSTKISKAEADTEQPIVKDNAAADKPIVVT